MVTRNFDTPRLLHQVIRLYLFILITVTIGAIAFIVIYTNPVTHLIPESVVTQVALTATGAYASLAIAVGVIIHAVNR